MKRSADRTCLSTVLTAVIATAAKRYASDRELPLSRVLDEALREYLYAREANPDLSPLANIPRRPGRPSRIDAVERAERVKLLRKRAGRPLKMDPCT